ncbi:MAG: TolC family protein [Bacteroidota bacterium]
MKKIFLLAISFLFATISFEQVKINTDLKTLINQSFTFFPKIQEVENAVKTAEEKKTLTALNKTPDISFSTSYNYIMPKISFPINGKEIQFAPVNNLAASVGTTYTLIDFGRLKSSINKAKADIEISKDNVNIVKNQLANQVAATYYNIIFYKKAIIIQDSIILYFIQNKQLAENKMKSGDMIQIDVLNLQSNIDAEENKKIDLINNLNKQLNLLEYVSGVKISKGEDFDFSLELSGVNIGVAQDNNPEFKLAKDKIIAAQKDVEIVRLNNKPRLSLNAATGVKNGYVPDVNEIKFNYLAGVTFSVPIYGFGKTKEQIKLQESIVKQNQLSQTSLAGVYKKDIEQNILDINSSVERIANTESQLQATKQAQQITASRYRNGVATYLDVTAAATNVEKAALSKLQYEYQLCMAKVELAKLLGFEYWNN